MVFHPICESHASVAMDDPALAVGRGLLFLAIGGRLALHATPEVSRDSSSSGEMAANTPAALRSIARKASGSPLGIGSGQGSDGHRMVLPGHTAACRSVDRTDAAAP